MELYDTNTCVLLSIVDRHMGQLTSASAQALHAQKWRHGSRTISRVSSWHTTHLKLSSPSCSRRSCRESPTSSAPLTGPAHGGRNRWPSISPGLPGCVPRHTCQLPAGPEPQAPRQLDPDPCPGRNCGPSPPSPLGPIGIQPYHCCRPGDAPDGGYLEPELGHAGGSRLQLPPRPRCSSEPSP